MTETQNNPEPTTTAEDMAKNRWRPSVEAGTYPSLEEIVGQAVGAGSVCWTSTPNGVFKSEQAKWIVDGAIAAIKRTVELDKPIAHQKATFEVSEQNYNALLKTADAAKWAAAFCTTFGIPESAKGLDEGAMISWFASAIETGKKHGRDDAMDRFEGECAESEPCVTMEAGIAEESAESRRLSLQRRQDQADLIDLILSYRNPASEETRMRQIRVVMD